MNILDIDLIMDALFGTRKSALYEAALVEEIVAQYKVVMDEFVTDVKTRAILDRLAGSGSMTDLGFAIDAEVLRQYEAFASETLGIPMAKATAPTVATAVAKEYRGGQLSIARKFGTTPRFVLQDWDTLEHIAQDTMHWVKDGAVRYTTETIHEVVRDGFVNGASRRAVAGTLEERLAKLYSVEKGRWTVVGSAAQVRSRNYSRILQMEQIGISTVEFVSVLDNRTSRVCRELNGKVWTIETVAQTVRRFTKATTPEEGIEAHPWVSVDGEGQWRRNTADRGMVKTSPDVVDRLGWMVPPLHGRCRSELIVNG